jgi:hypothetical protein
MKFNGSHSYLSTDARAEIKLKPCESCRLRGHYCEAQTTGDDEEPLCVFCADGVTCLHDQVEARRRKAMPAKLGPEIPRDAIADAKPPSGPRKPPNPNSPWRGNAGLILSNKAPQRPPSATPAATEAKKKETIPVKHDNENPRICSVEGCTTPLGKKNRTGRCAPHYYVRKGKGGSSARKATPPPQHGCQTRERKARPASERAGKAGRRGHHLRDGNQPEQLLAKTLAGRKSRTLSAAA